MSSPARAWIGLGANLGEPRRALVAALAAIAGLPGTRRVATSSPYRSASVGVRGPDYLNAVAAIETMLAPGRLLEALLAIECSAGRERPYRNAPRVLDLDLLLYDAQRIDTCRLVVPHPRMHERAFVLAPLAELAPSLEVPGRGPVRDLLAQVANQRIERLERPTDWPTP